MESTDHRRTPAARDPEPSADEERPPELEDEEADGDGWVPL